MYEKVNNKVLETLKRKKKKWNMEGKASQTRKFILLMLAPLVSGPQNYSKLRKNNRRSENTRIEDVRTTRRSNFQTQRANNNDDNSFTRCWAFMLNLSHLTLFRPATLAVDGAYIVSILQERWLEH